VGVGHGSEDMLSSVLRNLYTSRHDRLTHDPVAYNRAAGQLATGHAGNSDNSITHCGIACRPPLTLSGLADPSPLLKHELAYVLGQLGRPSAIPTLESVLVNSQNQHCSMVRHEAAEALGALSSESSLPLLRKYFDDPAREVRETCEIAVGKIEFDCSEEGKARKPK
jgi:hypothetical protein